MLRIIVLGLGTTLLVGLLWRLGPADILDEVARIGWYVVPVLLLGGAHHATRALALQASVQRAGVLSYVDALAIRLSGEAIQSLTFTGPESLATRTPRTHARGGIGLEEGRPLDEERSMTQQSRIAGGALRS